MKTSLDATTDENGFLADDELVLEPTRISNSTSVPRKSVFDTIAAGIGPSLTSDTQTLLRSRLMIVALIAGLHAAARYVFSLQAATSAEALASTWILARTLIAFAVFGLLASKSSFSLKQLRIVEYVLFGLLTAVILTSQYFIDSALLARGDLTNAVSYDKNSLLRITILMFLYGAFIPNEPKVASRMILTMAVGPLVVLVLLRSFNSGPAINQGLTGEIASSNAIFVILSAGVAILASYVINGLRTELHDARQLGQYVLGEKLGEGGMGEVYLAEHQLLKRPCALKLINAGIDKNPVAIARFEREVMSAATLTHPNTIQIYDYGHTPDGTFYYVMEYLAGLSLADLVNQFGPLPPGRAVYLLRQVCKSLGEAHRLGMVHRDLKPANIFVAILGGQCDVAKVLDFGLVKLTADPAAVQLTGEFTVSGTPSFMSPEQATGSREVDGRADIYALGAILYFMLTGRPPFEKDSPVALMIAHASEPVQPPSKFVASVPPDLDAVALRCLAKNAAERFQDTDSLAAAPCELAAVDEWDEMRAEKWWLEKAEQVGGQLIAGASG